MLDCNTVEKLIPGFLDDELEPAMLKEFLLHLDSCPDCKEELSIQFIVMEGLNTLETDNSYDIQKAYEERIAKSWHNVRIHKKLFWIRNIALIIATLSMIAGAVYLYLVFVK